MLGRSLLQVVVDMGESVLIDVGDMDVLVSVNITPGWDQFTSKDVDQGGLSGTVGANDGNTGSERAQEGNVANLGLGGTGVLEAHVGGTNDGLGLSLDTLEVARFGEFEVDLEGTKLIVRPSGRNILCKGFEVTPVMLKLEALVADDMLNNIIKEAGIVRDDDGGSTCWNFAAHHIQIHWQKTSTIIQVQPLIERLLERTTSRQPCFDTYCTTISFIQITHHPGS